MYRYNPATKKSVKQLIDAPFNEFGGPAVSIQANKIIYQTDQYSYFFGEKTSKIKTQGFSSSFHGNYMFLHQDESFKLICVDISKAIAEQIWSNETYVQKLVVTSDKVIVQGGKEREGGLGIPPGLPGVEMMPKRIIKAFDLESGEELWEIPKGIGHMVVSEDRIVTVLDENHALLIPGLMGPGEKYVMIRQYDIDDGDEFYEVKNETFQINLGSLKIIDNQLVFFASKNGENKLMSIKLR